jgi:DNA-binding CsgD family transcriptional regulator
MLSLTAAEAEVALALCDGQSRDTIAARRGVSPETVKAQVKSLYQKTGCHRETELVLLLRTMVE